MRQNKDRGQHRVCGNGASIKTKGAAAIALTAFSIVLPAFAWAQTAGGDGPAAPAAPPLSNAEAAKLNDKIAAAEQTPQDNLQRIVSETFTGTIISVPPDGNSVRIHRDDKESDETIYLYGVRAFKAIAPQDGKTPAARAYLQDHLKNARVRVEGRSRDKSGRLYALVTDVPRADFTLVTQPIDGSGANRDFPRNVDAPSIVSPAAAPTVNYALIRLGLARFDNRQSSDEVDLAGAESAARKEKKGYWSTPDASASASAATGPI